MRRYSREDVPIHFEGLEITNIDPDDRRTGIDCAPDLVFVMNLDERSEADCSGPLDQRFEGWLIQGGNDQQRDICAVGTCFPELITTDDEVLA